MSLNCIISLDLLEKIILTIKLVTSKLEHGLAFGTSKFYIAPYDKINHGLVNLSCNCDMKFGPKVPKIKI